MKINGVEIPVIEAECKVCGGKFHKYKKSRAGRRLHANIKARNRKTCSRLCAAVLRRKEYA